MAVRKSAPKRRPPSSRKLRELIACAYADPSIAGDLHIANLAAIVAWVESGTLPPGVKPQFRVVEKAG
jgi:hypothetical protein